MAFGCKGLGFPKSGYPAHSLWAAGVGAGALASMNFWVPCVPIIYPFACLSRKDQNRRTLNPKPYTLNPKP